jgi:hypothetical protein
VRRQLRRDRLRRLGKRCNRPAEGRIQTVLPDLRLGSGHPLHGLFGRHPLAAIL